MSIPTLDQGEEQLKVECDYTGTFRDYPREDIQILIVGIMPGSYGVEAPRYSNERMTTLLKHKSPHVWQKADPRKIEELQQMVETQKADPNSPVSHWEKEKAVMSEEKGAS